MHFSRMTFILAVIASVAIVASAPAFSASATYVGSETCGGCHDKEYKNFSSFAKKAKSDKSLKVMAPKLTASELESCFGCHTTGYGKPGGFKSFEETPELAHAGCEVCHGPGSAHVDSNGSPTLIKRKFTMKDCDSCHSQDRIKAFNFKPLLYGGAH